MKTVEQITDDIDIMTEYQEKKDALSNWAKEIVEEASKWTPLPNILTIEFENQLKW